MHLRLHAGTIEENELRNLRELILIDQVRERTPFLEDIRAVEKEPRAALTGIREQYRALSFPFTCTRGKGKLS